MINSHIINFFGILFIALIIGIMIGISLYEHNINKCTNIFKVMNYCHINDITQCKEILKATKCDTIRIYE